MYYPPDVVAIETNQYCNGSCKVCIRRHITRPPGQMPLELFKKIVDQIPDGVWIVPSAWNEPFTQPDIWDYIDYCERQQVMLYTNGTYLTERDYYKIRDSKHIKRVFVSFNGGTKDDYEFAMNLPFDSTYLKVKKLFSVAKREGLELNITSWVLPETIANISKLHILFPEADNITSHRYFNVRGLVDKLEGDPNTQNQGCARPLFYMSINYDGSMVPCCNAVNNEIVFGNVTDNHIKDLWLSEEFNEFRRKHLTGRIKEIELCKNCSSECRSASLYPFYSEKWKELIE